MIYYREIELKNFEIIQKKSLNYVNKSLTPDKLMTGGYFKIPNKFLQLIPELQNAFDVYDFGGIRTVALYISTKPTINYVSADNPLKNLAHTIKNPIHKDNDPHHARINIPILNTKGTFTRFFTNCVCKLWKNPFTQTEFHIVTNTDYIEVDAVEIINPTVLRVSEPHMVQINEGAVLPRITLTIGVHRDPVYLLE